LKKEILSDDFKKRKIFLENIAENFLKNFPCGKIFYGKFSTSHHFNVPYIRHWWIPMALVWQKRFKLPLCRAMAQAVSRRPLAEEAPVHAPVSPCEICGVQIGTGAGFIRVVWFSLSGSFHCGSLYSYIIWGPLVTAFRDVVSPHQREQQQQATVWNS
jgi:hypothetical protein